VIETKHCHVVEVGLTVAPVFFAEMLKDRAGRWLKAYAYMHGLREKGEHIKLYGFIRQN